MRTKAGGRTRARPVLLVLLVAVLAFGANDAWRRSREQTYIVASTSCPWRGPARITINPKVHPDWIDATRAHERVHAKQCAELGPVRYWLTNLRPAGKLSLEAPAYCAFARERLKIDPDTQYQSDRAHEDLILTMRNVDSADVKQALMNACSEIASKPRRTRAARRQR